MQNPSGSNLAHIVAHVILKAQDMGANEVWLRSGLAPVCAIESELRSVYERDLSRREVDLVCQMMRVVAGRTGNADQTSTQFDAPITDNIIVRCVVSQSTQMTELHMRFDEDADMSVISHHTPPRLLDAAG
jgi:Tfp pilus assembly pilus retraction ATPase PilT